MSTQSVADLLGENLTADPFGEDMAGSLAAGYIPDRSLVYIPMMILGPPLVGPVNDQQLQIYRDNRPIATDELGMQGPFQLDINKYGRHSAGRTFPLNLEWNAGVDQSMYERVPEQDSALSSPYDPSQLPDWGYAGNPAVEVIPGARTVFYTATPNVGWDGY